MTKALIVFCSCPTEAEAFRLARELVEGRLAACVNILPVMQSVFRWQGEIQTDTERLLLIKTTDERFAELSETLAKLHSYEVPEIVAVPIIDGNEKFLAWIRESV